MAILLCAALLWFLLMPSGASGVTIDFKKDRELYGNLLQEDLSEQDPDGALVRWACGPVAAVNSFAYLQRKYPKTYGDLIPTQNEDLNKDGKKDFTDHLIAVAVELAKNNYRAVEEFGCRWEKFLYGKQLYLQKKGVMDSTALEAWTYDQWRKWRIGEEWVERPDWVLREYASWKQIYRELVHCEDVEVLVPYGTSGHYLTVYGFVYEDKPGGREGRIDKGEAKLLVVDPLGQCSEVEIWDTSVASRVDCCGSTGFLRLVASESPIPELATASLLALAVVSLAAARHVSFWRRLQRH